ncbi:MAG: hypothetical protein JEZ14_14840 [Marinilabiliaceae bacterium]|nr:hypothetical protein [Marinilabiliaceae bacterium]
MIKKLFLTLTILLFAVGFLFAQNSINLSGEWQVKLDTGNELIQKFPDRCTHEGSIELPASLAEKGFGFKTEGSDFGILTPEYKYVGKAWYSREIEIPKKWKNKKVEIFLERVLWESVIIIDGKELSRQDALGTPHFHQLGKLTPGKHKLTIQVDNEMIHNIGDKGHAYGEYTQSIWNGIVGRMEMKAYDPVKIASVKTFPDIITDEIEVKLEIKADIKTKAKVNYEIVSLTSGEVILSGNTEQKLSEQDNTITLKIQANGQLKKWSEFTPEVYVLRTSIKAGKYTDNHETEFGFYQVSHDGTKLLINGKPIYLRGNLDCVHFPLTGYASCNVDEWERIFKIYKDYGLNHARFHSWCPPEAAFKAANRVGIYLQAEASIWIDWWMSENMIVKGRPEMDTKGYPKGLGYDTVRDSFVIAEMNRVVDVYGNHPSFTMFCIGNELGNSDFEVMKTWVDDLKKKDPRRLYAVSTARKITDVDDYCATHYIQGVGRTRGLNGPHTDWDFEKTYSKMNIPIIAHEIGQWPVYPKWSEIDKYTGVLKARNFEEFKAQAEKNGIADQNEDFAKASGALNQIMYKYETESFYRTASCAGVQLLSIQDYQGQGEALIGWLDAHWDSKGITTPKQFREHYNTTVPVLRMKKYVWTTDETFTATAQLSHHGAAPLNAECNWTISNEKGQLISNGTFSTSTFALGSLSNLGTINFNLNQIKKAEKLTVSIDVTGTEFRNQWDIWVYPASRAGVNPKDVLVTEKLDDQAKAVLENGGKVLLMAHESGTEENSVKAQFYPLYWSLTFFPGQGKTCIGLLLKDQHPAFTNFPTSWHSDWQWESISTNAKGFILNNMPETYKPIAQPVDDFHRNNKVGSIFELKVGKGKLLVCGYDLTTDKPVARQLKYSLLNYLSSSDFDPQYPVDFNWVKKTFPSIPQAEKADIPEEFKGAILYVNAAAKLTEKNKNITWTPELDELKVADKTSYQLKAAGVWKDDTGVAWHGKKMQLQINCPDGILGSLYVHFHDWDHNKRGGLLEFEGRKMKLGKHDKDGQWVKFHVMREDSNDGKLILKTNAQSGPNLMITKVVLVKE